MSQTIYDRYIENEVLSADPQKLVVILYRAAVEAVAGARVNLREGEIRGRSRRITKASSIIHELLRSLNHTEGGEISRNLAELYTYMQQRLIEANANQMEPPLAEVETLLRTLLEGWTETARASTPPVAVPAELQYAEHR
ncbi:MAG: flagellar export chaperone FliS [Bryobacteraceae bacterium]